MVIRYIETENFLSHKKEQVALPSDGTFLLSGESGAGKSSFIVDALAYALFGVVATRAKKQSELIYSGESEMSVRITFDLPDIRLTVARGLDSRGASWAKIWDSGKEEILAEGVAPTGRIIRQYLGGITWQQFYAAFVARQSEIALLTSLRGAERKNLVQRMLGMRELEKAGEILQSRYRRLSAEKGQLERSLGDFDLLAEEEELGQEEERLESDEKRWQVLEQDLIATQKERESEEADLAPLLQQEAAWRANQEGRERRAQLEVRLTQAKKESEKRQAAEKLLAEHVSFSVDEVQEERDRLRDLFRRSKEYLSLKKELDGLPVISDTPSLAELESKIAVLENDLKNISLALQEKEKALSDIEKSGKCYLCQRPTEHNHQEIIDNLSAEIAAWQEKREEVQKDLQDSRDLRPKSQERDLQLTKKTKVEDKMNELENGGVETDLKKLEEAGRKSSKRLEEAQELKGRLDAARKEVLLGSAEEVKKLEQEIASIKNTEAVEVEGLEERRKKIENLKREEGRLIGEKKGLGEALEERRESLRKRKESLAKLHKELEALQALRTGVLRLEKLQAYLKAYQKHLAHEIRPALEEVGSEMLQRISGGRHVAMHIDDDYEIEVEDSSGHLLRSGMISGGEAIRANICLRLALTRLVSQRTGVPIGFLVFDEPLPAQDPGHIERILELLESLKPFYQQQFIISHVGDLRAADPVDYVLEFDAQKEERIHLLAA